jgi:hypothetical protein
MFYPEMAKHWFFAQGRRLLPAKVELVALLIFKAY